MTSSAVLPRRGSQLPRVSCWPEYSTTVGPEAVALAASAGLELDPWQELVLEHALGIRGGRWAAFEVGVVVPRQNGKGGVTEALELAALFVLGESLVMHSAHQFKTAKEAYRRVKRLIEETPDLLRQVKRTGGRVSGFRQSNEEHSIELATGQRLLFVARANGSGRGFTGKRLIWDEAFSLTPDDVGDTLPTLSAVPNPQVWYTSTPPKESTAFLGRLRERGHEGSSGRLAYFEWSVPTPGPGEPPVDLDDRAGWAQANPALGIRIDEDFIEAEREAMDDETFARERLGVWPLPGSAQQAVIDLRVWASWADASSSASDPVVLAVDATPDRRSASIGVAGVAGDRVHVEVVESRAGMAWLVPALAGIVKRQSPTCVVIDPASAAYSLVPELEKADIKVLAKDEVPGPGVTSLVPLSGRDVAAACGAFYDDAIGGRLVHLGQAELAESIASARKKARGDAFVWNRRDLAADVSPLMAVTLARFGLVAELVKPDERGPELW